MAPAISHQAETDACTYIYTQLLPVKVLIHNNLDGKIILSKTLFLGSDGCHKSEHNYNLLQLYVFTSVTRASCNELRASDSQLLTIQADTSTHTVTHTVHYVIINMSDTVK